MNTKRDIRSHFHLNITPFTREFSINEAWQPAALQEHRDDLLETIHDRMSAAIIAPAGAGKSVLLRSLAHSLPEARFRVHYVKVTRLSARDFCRQIATALGSDPAGHYGALVRRIQERSLALMDQDALRPIIMLDESHDMRPEVLAILRVLTNFQMDSRLVVSLVLAGQPPLKALLSRQELEAVSRRLAHYVTLRLLSRAETRQYIAHRLRVAGAQHDLFDDQALEAIYEVGQGNMRATDRVALKAMQLACRQAAPVVDAEHVARARQMVTP